MTSKPFTTCLWFDNQGEEAAHYYMSIFKNSRLGRMSRYTSAGPGPEGSVATVEFELNGQKFLALNGGPQFKFNPAVSLVIECADQAEIDYYWDRLSVGGQEIDCGWVQASPSTPAPGVDFTQVPVARNGANRTVKWSRLMQSRRMMLVWRGGAADRWALKATLSSAK